MTEKNYLSIDVGGTHIKYSLMNSQASILDKGKVCSPDNKEAFWKSIDHLIEDYLDKDIQGIAFSVPGKVDTQKGIVYFGGVLTYLHGATIKDHIFEKYQLPTTVQNDGKAAALAELWLGSLKGVTDGAAIVLGTGVGGGIILNGQLRNGLHYQAGELSFMILNSDTQGTNKTSGSLGSAVHMVESINRALGYSDLKNGLRAFKAINAGEPMALALFRKYCRSIAYIIHNVHTTLDLDTFAIGGGISTQPILIEEINHQYDKMLLSQPVIKRNITRPKIIKAYFENDANLYGALYHLLQEVNKK